MQLVQGRSALPCGVARTHDGPVHPDHHALDLLSEQECLELLGTSTLGRLGLSAGALPYVLPVRYVLDDRRILVGTGADTPLSAACDGAVVAFQTDGFDDQHEAGWSVVVQGLARSVPPPGTDHVLRSWLGPLPASCLAIPIGLISGQRIGGASTGAADGR